MNVRRARDKKARFDRARRENRIEVWTVLVATGSETEGNG